ncbi:glycosyltransferase family 76 protein [Thecamonas trahens ATCC 50062]|uniref:GPI mannosyltransferase 2 n=1 Tax=Thecamonas trahens ATCC 50062 TaxID=461836 RepID=A0A0L0D3I4_THETB|nr:glycosyltransferase family 76 protein [Thecamonas trahens ATCC 50062]KNC46892.1 glycosyltransferase family 76 protein [Thecamonas trahens ATCC 50062]|eukprot:XP_013760165.1 glycosyltransferase family 76 protein [Thecamonas trahens ATCC 50062]
MGWVAQTVAWGVCSRVVVAVVMAAAAACLPPFDASGSRAALGHAANWDGIYYTAIADRGYVYEHEMAFFPGWPLLLRAVVAASAGWLSPPLAGALIASVAGIAAALAVAWSAGLVYEASKGSKWLHGSGVTRETFMATAGRLHALSPASVFGSVAYTEAPFAAVAFAAVAAYLWLATPARRNDSTASRVLASVSLVVAGVGAGSLRSNGMLLSGLAVALCVRAATAPAGSTLGRLAVCAAWLGASAIMVVPYLAFQVWGASEVCGSGVVAHDVRPHCGASIVAPLKLYSYIQATYWGNGFLAYYEWKQVPNFALAAPILVGSMAAIACYGTWLVRGWRVRLAALVAGRDPVGVLVLHWAFLVAVATLFMHIQVATRMLCSSTPCVFWASAWLLHNPRHNRWAVGLVAYGVVWNTLGAIMFPTFYPWT